MVSSYYCCLFKMCFKNCSDYLLLIVFLLMEDYFERNFINRSINQKINYFLDNFKLTNLVSDVREIMNEHDKIIKLIELSSFFDKVCQHLSSYQISPFPINYVHDFLHFFLIDIKNSTNLNLFIRNLFV